MFSNELHKPIDSLAISVGNRTTVLYGPEPIEGNIAVPTRDYPHPVTITVFSTGLKDVILGDSFNCYNCDGSHEYILKSEGAVYRFRN